MQRPRLKSGSERFYNKRAKYLASNIRQRHLRVENVDLIMSMKCGYYCFTSTHCVALYNKNAGVLREKLCFNQ